MHVLGSFVQGDFLSVSNPYATQNFHFFRFCREKHPNFFRYLSPEVFSQHCAAKTQLIVPKLLHWTIVAVEDSSKSSVLREKVSVFAKYSFLAMKFELFQFFLDHCRFLSEC